MASAHRQFDSIFERLIDEIESSKTALRAAIEEAASDIDTRSINVMISSPLKHLHDERDALYLAIKNMPQVEPLMYEKREDSGKDNLNESLSLVQQCDLFIALLDPAYEGTHIAKPESERDTPSEDGRVGKTYSQIETEKALERHGETGWPRIFVFVKTAKQGEALKPWQRALTAKFAPTPMLVRNEGSTSAVGEFRHEFGTVSMLVEAALVTLNAHVIRIRYERARKLSQQVVDLKYELKNKDTELSVRIEQHQKLDSVLQQTHDRAVDSIKKTTDGAIDRQQQEIKSLHSRLAGHRARTVWTLCVGTALGVISIVSAFLALGVALPRFDVSKLVASIGSATDLLASSVRARPLFAASSETDLVLLARKIHWASAQATGFECGTVAREVWPVDLPNARGVLKLVRDNVCSSNTPLRIDIDVEGTALCKYETAFTSKGWEELQESLRNSKLEISHVVLVGHASTEQITNNCGLVREVRKACGPDNETFFTSSSERIEKNRELAYSRACMVAKVIRNGMPKDAVSVDQLGELDAKNNNGQADRKVSMFISVRRAQRR
jgi:hypothetical protein